MFHSGHIHRSGIACGIVLALAVPGAALAQQDLRSPQIFTDQQRAIVEHYKRSPSYQATLREVRAAADSPQPAPVRSDGGLDWADAAIGAAGMLAVMLTALGGAVAVNHRRPAATSR